MLKKLTALALAIVLATGVVTLSSKEAEARRVGYGIAAGILAGTILGAYAYGSRAYAGPYYYSYSAGPHCYKGPRQCDYAGRSCWHDRFGDYVCRGGARRCWRPTICD